MKTAPRLPLIALVPLIALLLAPGPAVADEPADDAGTVEERARPEVVAFVGVHVMPMDRERVLLNRTVLVEGGRIARIGKAGKVTVPEGALTIEGRGRYLLPGLAEMHAHVPPTSDGAALRSALTLFVANGVTTIRGMLGEPGHLLLRERLASGELLGPTLVTSGPSLNGGSVSSVEEARRTVRSQAEAGYDFLKLHPGLSRELFDAIVDQADESGMTFAGHVSAEVGLFRALEAGQATVDHLDGYVESMIRDDTGPMDPSVFFGLNLVDVVDREKMAAVVARTRKAGTWNVPTQSLIEHALSAQSPAEMARWPEMRFVPEATVEQWLDMKREFQGNPGVTPGRAARFVALRRELIRELHEAGCGLLLGSDAPQVFNVPGFALHREMRILADAGISSFDVLSMGTRNVARFLGQEGEFGLVKEGLRADLLLVDGDPLADIGLASRISGVMVRGRWLPDEELRSLVRDVALHARPPAEEVPATGSGETATGEPGS